MASDDFSLRLEALDLSLFDIAPSQSSDEDRRSLLVVQRSIRLPSGYTYLEIGSHLGGSIQQHLLDPMCRKIISIDKRPESQPDDSGQTCDYPGNSTERMLNILRKVAPGELGKIITIDSDAKDVNLRLVPEPPQFCFIDGEHTRSAALSDFVFCLSVCDPNGVICFHDASTIHPALSDIVSYLKKCGIKFNARMLDGSVFAIFLGSCSVVDEPFIRSRSRQGDHWLRWQRQLSYARKFTPKSLWRFASRVAHSRMLTSILKNRAH